MPRRVQDIVPNDRRSIRDVVLSKEKSPATSHSRTQPEKRSPKSRDEIVLKIHKIEDTDNDSALETGDRKDKDTMRRMAMTPPEKKKKSHKKKGIWLGVSLSVFVLIGVAGFLASTYFSRAVFTITPKVIPVSVNNTLVIKSGVVNDLAYEVITMKESQSVVVPSVDGPAVSTKAQGSVTVYNSYSASSVRLIAGTRLSDESGRVYRLNSSINIPGYTNKSGSIVAGSIVTKIVADQPGSSYNISQADSVSDFKIVAYKGSTKYDDVYARLKSDISGGAQGVKKVVNPNVLASSTTGLKASLLSALVAQVKSSVPLGYIMYDSGYSSAFSAPIVSGSEKNQAVVTVNGVVYGIIFKKAALVSKLAGINAVSVFADQGYTSPGLESLSFTISNMKDFAPEKKGTLIVNMKGSMKLVGTIPIDDLKSALAGKSLAESQSVLKRFSAVIENADGELVPPWSKIPSNVSRIVVNVKGE
ncbi:MAG: hypothetical protein WCP09_03800 [Candidatus Taylorbacteria bacterium]